MTSTLVGDPLAPVQSQSDKAKQMQLGGKSDIKCTRSYMLGACELFPDTPVLVDFTQFSLF